MNASGILHELVAIPTPSAVSNVPLIDWVRRFVEAKGWRAEVFPYTDDNGIQKANLIARPRSAPVGREIDLAFVCHTDTVPYAPDWKSALQLGASGDGAFLHGCGACDVKGALASFLAALDGLRADQVTAGVALILTADEEIGCKGMERLMLATSLRIRSAMVSEPTSLRPGIAGKGYGLARVVIQGMEAHSAFPAEGISAIALAARYISRLDKLMDVHAERWDSAAPADALFDPPQTTVNVGVIQGGSAKNIVAGECSFLVEWRPIPADPPHAMFEQLESLAEEVPGEERRCRIRVELLRAEPGFAPSIAGPLRKRLAESAARAFRTPHPETGISFGSEASRLARVADEVIVIGPGDMHTAHSERECVPVAELDEWSETLRDLLGEFQPRR